MGYFIGLVMHFYSMQYSELLKLPVYTFWEFYKQINKVSAFMDKRQFALMSNVVSMAFGGKTKEYTNGLERELRSVYMVEEAIDNRAQINKLKTLLGG